MELVRQFSSELNSIYDGKLPVSRAKMASITRSAVKSLKYYKHVVMTVEKFISKCGPEYKLPGLYVVDSIVRQSRHQFGTEKDVFGPRFSKNIEKTFRNLFVCTPSDQPKVMRVLNLWQKNEVFPTDVIQIVMTLAPNPDATPSSTAPVPPMGGPEDEDIQDLSSANAVIQQQQSHIQTLLQQQQQLQSQTSTLLAPALQTMISQQSSMGSVDGDVLSSLLQQAQQLQSLQNQLAATTAVSEPESQPVFNTALLDDDFDYSSEEEGSARNMMSRQREETRHETPFSDVGREPSSPPPADSGRKDTDAIIRQLEMQVMKHQQKAQVPVFKTPSPPKQQSLPPPPHVSQSQGGQGPSHLGQVGGHLGQPRLGQQVPPHLSQAGGLKPPHLGQPVPSHLGQPVPPHLGQPVPPHLGQPVPPHLGQPVPPHLGQPVPPHLGQPVPPHLGQPVPPHLGQPMPPYLGQPLPPHLGQPVLPHLGQPPIPPPLSLVGGQVPQRLSQAAPHFNQAPPHPQQMPPHQSQMLPHMGLTMVRDSARQPPPPPPPNREPHHFPPREGFPPTLAPRDHHSFAPPMPRPPRGEWEHHDNTRACPPKEPRPPSDVPPPPRSIPTFYHSNRRSPSPARRDRYHSPPPGHSGHGGRSSSPPGRRGSGHWRDTERDRDRDSSHRSKRSPRRHRSRSRSPHVPRRATPPLSLEEKERKRKGIPMPKDKHVSVCSCTIWVGHLPKTVKQQQIMEAFENFGQVKSVDVVAARGCAYVVMVHRNDAVRALGGLKETGLAGSQSKLAWAPGRGVKGATYRSCWKLEEGVSYIPWDMIEKEEELSELGEGGWIEPKTCPPGMSPPTLGGDILVGQMVASPTGPGLPPLSAPPPGPMPHPTNNMGPPHMPPRPPDHMIPQRPPPTVPRGGHMGLPNRPPSGPNYMAPPNSQGVMMGPQRGFMPSPNAPYNTGPPPHSRPPLVRFDHPPPPHARPGYMHPQPGRPLLPSQPIRPMHPQPGCPLPPSQPIHPMHPQHGRPMHPQVGQHMQYPPGHGRPHPLPARVGGPVGGHMGVPMPPQNGFVPPSRVNLNQRPPPHGFPGQAFPQPVGMSDIRAIRPHVTMEVTRPRQAEEEDGISGVDDAMEIEELGTTNTLPDPVGEESREDSKRTVSTTGVSAGLTKDDTYRLEGDDHVPPTSSLLVSSTTASAPAVDLPAEHIDVTLDPSLSQEHIAGTTDSSSPEPDFRPSSAGGSPSLSAPLHDPATDSQLHVSPVLLESSPGPSPLPASALAPSCLHGDSDSSLVPPQVSGHSIQLSDPSLMPPGLALSQEDSDPTSLPDTTDAPTIDPSAVRTHLQEEVGYREGTEREVEEQEGMEHETKEQEGAELEVEDYESMEREVESRNDTEQEGAGWEVDHEHETKEH